MHLLLNKTLVNGDWISASSKKELAVLNPVNGSVVGNVPDMDASDTQKAIDSASKAFYSKEWYGLTAKDRSSLLKKWFNLLEVNKQEIANIMTAESGKPITESLGEIAYGNSFVEWFAEEARRIYGEIVPSPHPQKQIYITREPIGVAALITPWNFPHAMITRKAAAALAAGCTVVIKPAEDTPLTCLALAKLAEEAGFPKGVVNVITCSRSNAPSVGDLLCKSPLVAGISFTGSTEVGRLLYEKCASGIKRVGLELGGNAPFIVFESADLTKALNGALASKFRNCGQTCISSNRFLVHESLVDEFVARLTAAVNGLVIGDGKESNVQIGPLVNDAQLKKVSAIVADGVSKGAKVIVGGKALPDKGQLYYAPTIMTNIQPNMRLYTEEIFGPVVSIITFKTEDEALRIANDTRRGLAGYFFSENISQVFRVARRLEVGMIGINDGAISAAEAAFGGVKESGIGREGSKHGIDDYVEMKYLCLGNLE
ncbi:succinate-semialdehyde dehydrogenase [NADP(+)] GabD isoform X2 [Bradysia coprophila]|nr:succinate-semialdehyde dehydrogenase [NADP(+)] GabD isoform X2 [Bradysia coprophila]